MITLAWYLYRYIDRKEARSHHPHSAKKGKSRGHKPHGGPSSLAVRSFSVSMSCLSRIRSGSEVRCTT